MLCVCIPILVMTFPEWLSGIGSIATHTRSRASVLVAFVVFCMHMNSFASLIRWMPPPMFSDTAITDCHFDTTIFQLGAHWVPISWSIGLEKSFGHVPPVRVEPSTSCMQGEHPIHLARLSASLHAGRFPHYYMLDKSICHFRGVRSILSLL